ncbi:MAG TPA: UPF0182 family protein [Abditibacteriaceae bacterium]|jgi:hypothetical protein
MIGSRRWAWLLALLVVAFVSAPRFAQVYVEALWFDSLGYSPVFWKTFWWKFGLFVGFFGITLALVRGGLWAIEHAFSGYILGGTVTRFDEQQVELEPERYARPIAWGVSVVWSLLVGLAMGARWELFTLFFAGAEGSVTDPIFRKPLEFFLFRWPVLKILASWLSGICLLVFLGSLIYAALVWVSQMPDILKRAAKRTAARTCSLSLAAVLVVYAWRCLLGRYSQLWRNDDIFSGIGYTQANIVLPGLVLVAAMLVAGAALAVANAFLWRRPRYVAIAFALPLVAWVGLGLVSSYVDNFVVKPNQLERQTPYIKHNIEGTRRAFALDRVTTRDFPTAAGIASLEADKPVNRTALDNIRLWDVTALQATLRQGLQRTYYDYPDVDVDRYTIGGQKRQVMIAAREMDIERLPAASRNWVNERLVYTHGYGVTMNTANGFTAEGRPRFILSGVPVKSTVPELKVTRPEIYFGQKTDTPVYVQTRQKEFDFPQGKDNAFTTYAGKDGIVLGRSPRRTILAWALGDLSKVPFSGDITPESRVLLHRNIRDRAQRLAPFLSFDADPYIVIDDKGRLKWILDAYTSSIYYPYSRHYLSGNGWTNYLRNSVKVVVDAYDGTADFYVFEPQDPIIKAYRAAFPTLFKDAATMPADLRAHIRYPEQLFRTQADVYGLYQMTDVRSFFGREDVWSIAGEDDAPVTTGPIPPGMPLPQTTIDAPSQPLDPYFVLMPLPGQKPAEEFVQILPFTPTRRRQMSGWMAGRSDAENYGSLLVYNFPKEQLPEGPTQIKARINQDAELSPKFTLWNQQGSKILRGNMLVIPLGRSVLYVEPIFLQASQSPTPELRLVVLATQDRIVHATNFRDALTKLLGTSSAPLDSETIPATAPEVAPRVPDSAAPAANATNRQRLIESAARDLEDHGRLTAQGRYSEAGQRLERLRRTLNQLQREAR